MSTKFDVVKIFSFRAVQVHRRSHRRSDTQSNRWHWSHHSHTGYSTHTNLDHAYSYCIMHIHNMQQEAFEKCWAHSPLRAVLHCHSPGVATVARRHCRTPPAHHCPRQRRQWQRVTEGTAHRMGPTTVLGSLHHLLSKLLCTACVPETRSQDSAERTAAVRQSFSATVAVDCTVDYDDLIGRPC